MTHTCSRRLARRFVPVLASAKQRTAPLLLAAAFLAMPVRESAAQSTGADAPMVIDVAELEALQGTPQLVVLQVSSAAQFDSVHVPGARPVSLSEISTPRERGSLILELPATAKLEAWARGVGISNNSRIVIVPAATELQSSTRVFLTLTYMGLGSQASILDGGLIAWRAAGKPVETGSAPALAASSAPLTVRPDSSIIAVITDVDSAIADAATTVIDARLPRFYEGNGGGYPRPGHVPTAVNVSLATVSENAKFKSPDELRALFAAAGVSTDAKVITYCHIGQQATLLWFVARRLGYDARMFDGSFQQWSGSDRPVVAPAPN